MCDLQWPSRCSTLIPVGGAPFRFSGSGARAPAITQFQHCFRNAASSITDFDTADTLKANLLNTYVGARVPVFGETWTDPSDHEVLRDFNCGAEQFVEARVTATDVLPTAGLAEQGGGVVEFIGPW